MLIKRLQIIWVKVDINKGKRLCFNIPLSLYAFYEFLDCTIDLLNVANFFIPNRQQKNFTFSVHTIKVLMEELIYLIDSLIDSEPYEFVNIEAENIKVSIKIK